MAVKKNKKEKYFMSQRMFRKTENTKKNDLLKKEKMCFTKLLIFY